MSKEEDQVNNGENHDHPFDGRNVLKECFTLFGGKYYDSFIPGMTDLVKLARDPQYYKDPAKHFSLQVGLLDTITKMDEVVAQGKQEARKKSDDKDIAIQRKRNRVIALAYRQISDGIAWRSVGYSRFTIRVVSQARSPGSAHGKEIGRKKEMDFAANVVRNNGYVLVHDATNVLRVGDLSALKSIPGIPYLSEVKNKKGIATPKDIDERLEGGSPTTKQEDRLWQAQIMLSSRKLYVEGGTIPVTEISAKKKDFLVSAGAVLKQAVSKGVYGKMLSSYMYIEAFDVRKNMKDFKDTKSFQLLLDTLPSPSEELLSIHSNYDTIATLMGNEVMRSVPPYTIFPFSAEIVAKLITGQLVFRTKILRKELENEFLKYGYELIINEKALDAAAQDEDHVAFLSSRILFPDKDPDAFVHIRHNKSGFMYPMQMFLATIAYEFLSVEYIVSVAEAVRATAKPGEQSAFYPEITDSYRWL